MSWKVCRIPPWLNNAKLFKCKSTVTFYATPCIALCNILHIANMQQHIANMQHLNDLPQLWKTTLTHCHTENSLLTFYYASGSIGWESFIQVQYYTRIQSGRIIIIKSVSLLTVCDTGVMNTATTTLQQFTCPSAHRYHHAQVSSMDR